MARPNGAQVRVAEYLKLHPRASTREIAAACACSENAVKDAKRFLRLYGVPTARKPFVAALEQSAAEPVPEGVGPGEHKVTEEEQEDTRHITVVSCDIRSVDELLAFSKVDTNIWEVERQRVNSWTVTMGKAATGTGQPERYTNYQVTAWLRRRVAKTTQDALEHIIESMRQHAPKYPMITRPALAKRERFMYEIAAVVDPHLARMSWGKETGIDWDMKLATGVLLNAVEDLLARSAPYAIEKILLPLGNDTFEINDTTNATPRNHNALYVDGRYINVFERGFECLRGVVDRCLQVAPVEILWIPGNHDPQTSYHVVRLLEMNYANCKDVTVDRSPPTRKAVVYGPTFLGFTHGCDVGRRDVAAIFMSEFRDRIAGCRHLEVHMGHTHQMKETRTLFGNTELGGVRTRVLQSLTARSNWEYEMGFTNFQCAEAYLWSKISGYAGHHSVYARFNKEDAA
jgi:hypothetical protein